MSPHRALRHGPIYRRLTLEDFHKLMEELLQWRIDPEIQKLEKKKPGGLVLGFVKGLRLSARLIYAIRKNLSQSNLEVDWGHLLDVERDQLSPECDIIIHRKGYIQRWNGDRSDKIMDVSFVDSRLVIAVISCKSSIKAVDVEYCKRMRKYVPDILLFAECCTPGAVKKLKESAKSAGYKGFWYLYTCTRSSEHSHDENQWEDFIEVINRITARRLRRRY
jgi:hypothetical protein